MRVFLYVQGLSGSGHVVRIDVIARALAENHDVFLTDGGRPVPRRPLPDRVRTIALPRILRDGPALAPLDADRDIDDVLAERLRLLVAAVEKAAPDVLLVEHFPVSKWILNEEILAVIDAARRTRPGVQVVSSLRDISPRHRYDTDSEEHRRRTRRLFEKHFDRLLVHADPRFVGIEEHIGWAGELTIPVDYTGFVSEKPGGNVGPGGEGDVVVSAGGAGSTSLPSQAIAAWRLLTARGEDGGRTLWVHLPLRTDEGDASRLRRESQGLRARVEPFSSDFLERVRRADLSLSHAGYNTCMNLLETRTRALVAPIPVMADQTPRARRLADHGLARVLLGADLEAEPLGEAMLEALELPRPEHNFDLDGARRTGEILEGLVASIPAAADPLDAESLARLRDAFRGVPRAVFAGAHVYPAAAPAFTPSPRAARPRPDHPHLRLYVHVPFCRSKCSFCFYAVKVPKDRAEMERYVLALERELAWAEPGTPLSQLFVGGGTPTALPAELLARLLDAVFSRMPQVGGHVHVVEASPDTVTADHVEVMRRCGTGRVSMGVQTLDNPVLGTVRRSHEGRKALEAVRLLLEHDLILNVDLMYGLPGQTMEAFRRDVERLRAEGVHSLTLYDLRISRTTPVARRLGRDEWLSLDHLLRWRAFTKATVEGMGYTQTRWHTFKLLDGPAARHERAPEHTGKSLGYQLGIGLSARSHLGDTIYRNHRSFPTYLARIEAGESPVQDIYELDEEDRRIIHVARSLGDGQPLDTVAYDASFGTTIEDDFGAVLTRLTDAGALARTHAGYELTETGKLIHDLVTLAFYPARMQEWLKERQPPELVIGGAGQ